MPGRFLWREALTREPMRPCRHHRCSTLVEGGGFCEKHKGGNRDYDKRRGSSTARGYGAKWQRFRKLYLKANPLCRPCDLEGRTTEATAIDHIVPVTSKDDPAFWDEQNMQPICQPCHSRKTALEDGGFGREKRAV